MIQDIPFSSKWACLCFSLLNPDADSDLIFENELTISGTAASGKITKQPPFLLPRLDVSRNQILSLKTCMSIVWDCPPSVGPIYARLQPHIGPQPWLQGAPDYRDIQNPNRGGLELDQPAKQHHYRNKNSSPLNV